MELLPFLVVAIVVVCGLYMIQPPVVFKIRYRNGIPKVVRGRLTERDLASIHEICRQNQVMSGTIIAIPHGKRWRMKFGGDISPGCQQQIRNMILASS